METKTLKRLHIIFWIAVFIFAIMNTLAYIGNELFIPVVISVSMRTVFNMLTFYLFYLSITQKIFTKKKVIIFAAGGIIYLTVFSFIFSFLYYIPISYKIATTNPFTYSLTTGIKNVIYSIFAYQTIFAISGSLSKVSLIWYSNQIKQHETAKQNITTELAMLRAQINPHFLFNTLNNIKSLIKKMPSKAVISIEKLNGIMEYMINESSNEKVPMRKEIEHIRNYLELEKIRYSDAGYIDFRISGNYQTTDIPPLIFMPFIENAFKHGNKLSKSPGIEIGIEVSGEEINFRTKNYIKDKSEMQSRNSGFGLTNIRRRLDLIFENRYKLDITNSDKIFSVNLKINLR